jgi:hypothetical protein
MELEISLQCSQQPATGPYPESDASSPHPHHPVSLRSSLILFSHVRVGLPSGSCHQDMARPRVADRRDDIKIWRVAANTSNKQLQTGDKGWYSGL